jgi:RNA polymerase sigma factor (sigma-70 family)
MKLEMLQRVRASLDSLPADDRELLTLKYLERLPTREIAAVIGVSEKVVRARHRRALQQLRILLDDAGDSNQ